MLKQYGCEKSLYLCDQTSECKLYATGRSYCSWEDDKDRVCMAAKTVEDHNLKPLFVKKDGRGTSGQSTGLRCHYLKKDGE